MIREMIDLGVERFQRLLTVLADVEHGMPINTGLAWWKIMRDLFRVLFILAFCVAAGAADWPCYRGPNKNGATTEGIASWPPRQIWRASVGQGYSDVAVSGGRVYITGWSNGHDTVYCFGESSVGTNPAPLWTQSYSCSSVDHQGTRATPTVDSNTVYTFSHDGLLSCFDCAAGTLLWNKQITGGSPGEWDFASSPLIEGNLVIFNAGGQGTAVDKTTHNVVWGNDGNSSGYSSAFAFTRGGTDRTVVIYSSSVVYGLNPTNGAVRWYSNMSTSYGSMADPMIYNDQLLISRGYGAGSALVNLGSGQISVDGGTNEWSNSGILRTKENSCVICNGYAYGIDEDNGLECVDLATGNLKWSSGGSVFPTESSVLLANNQLVMMKGQDGGGSGGNDDLVVAQACPTNYTELYRTNQIISGDTVTCPTLANGKLYIRSQTGILICYNVSYSTNSFSNCVPPAVWFNHYYPGVTNFANAATNDTDGDGWTAWQEYLAGTNPTNCGSCLKAVVVMSNGNIVVTYPTLSIATGMGYTASARYYGLEGATNLSNAVWMPVQGGTNVLGNNATAAYTNTNPSGTRFYRVKATLQ
jgi:outer membrane protein assembly factor BamB